MGRSKRQPGEADDGEQAGGVQEVFSPPVPPAPPIGAVAPGMLLMQPGMLQPGMQHPGMLQQTLPGMLQPGMMQPGMLHPGMLQAGMTGLMGQQASFPSMMTANPLMMTANPLLAQNPLLMGNLLTNQSMLHAAIRPPQAPTPGPPPVSNMIDPDVQELCDHFHIEERHTRRLSDLMKNRQNTFVEDLERLYDVLERANSPAGLLVVKMREMDEGVFVGKVKADKELAAMSKKYKLDDQAESKLADILARYEGEKRKEYLLEIEKHLEVSNRPSAMAMMLLRKLGDGVSLGRPGPPAPGSYVDKSRKESSGGGDRNRDKDKDRRPKSRSKQRERSRDRDKDRREREKKRSRSKSSKSSDSSKSKKKKRSRSKSKKKKKKR